MAIEFSTLQIFWVAFLHFVTVVSILLTLLFVSQILRSPRVPSTTIGWLAIVILVPILGIPLYLIFGIRKLNASLQNKTKIDFPDRAISHSHPINSMLSSLGIPSSSSGNIVNFHNDGRSAWEDLLRMLEAAEESIHIAIFILGDDRFGTKIIDCLVKKASQGVDVKLLLDGIGCFKLPKNLLLPLSKNGGEVAWFMPVIHRPLRGSTNLRNHRKIIIVDQKTVWTGGRNLDAAYLTLKGFEDRWIDLSFSLQGEAVSTFCAIFSADWNFTTGCVEDNSAANIPVVAKGESPIQVIPSGPDIPTDPIYAATLTACYGAQLHIMLVTPYYVPDSGVQEALTLAALRGVMVDIILPATSNHRLADIARNRYLRELAEAGTRIWVVPDKMVHAKALVIDTTFAMAGSANMDIRSLFMNFEVMTAFYSETDIHWLSSWLESLRDQSERYYPPEAGAFQEMIEGCVLLGAYQL